MKPVFVALLFLALPISACNPTEQAAPVAAAPAAAPGPLEGAWKRVETVIADGQPNAGTHTTDVQPSLHIFSKTHYSSIYLTTYAPRPALSDAPTDAEQLAAFQPVVANAGTYKLDGTTLTLSPVVAKSPNAMAGQPPNPIAIEWAGDDVWFTATTASGVQNRARLTRVPD